MAEGNDANELVVTGAWTAEAEASVMNGSVDRLVLNHALGFDEPSLDFLEGLPLRELVVLDRRQTSLVPILSMAGTLRSLRITTDPRAVLDLTDFGQLTDLAADWPQVADTIRAAVSLSTAFLRGYGENDLTPLAGLTALRGLEMKDRPRLTSLEGLSALTGLRSLGIYLAKDLSDIGALADRSDLERLALEACRRIDELDALSGCVGLRELNLSEDGDIASLEPIRHLAALEHVAMHGSTRIADGNLKPLAGLPRLIRLRMQSRRSYQPSVEEIQASLPRGS